MEKGCGVKTYLNCGGLAQEFSEEGNINMWPKEWSCDILGKILSAFCPCPKSLPEAKVKSFGLIPLAEEISKQPSIDSVVWL